MNKRLALFIDYKTGGNQKEFADLMGWSPQYLHKMLKGDSMGIQPVIALLEKFPELDARWLILGEGSMLTPVLNRIIKLLTLEKYIPVMNSDELDSIMAGRTDFGEEAVSRWEELLAKRNDDIEKRFEAAYKRQPRS